MFDYFIVLGISNFLMHWTEYNCETVAYSKTLNNYFLQHQLCFHRQKDLYQSCKQLLTPLLVVLVFINKKTCIKAVNSYLPQHQLCSFQRQKDLYQSCKQLLTPASTVCSFQRQKDLYQSCKQLLTPASTVCSFQRQKDLYQSCKQLLTTASTVNSIVFREWCCSVFWMRFYYFASWVLLMCHQYYEYIWLL